MHSKLSNKDKLKSVMKYVALFVVFVIGIISVISSAQLPYSVPTIQDLKDDIKHQENNT